MSDAPTTVQPAAPPTMSIGTHPRFRRTVRRARALGGLIGFTLTIVLSLRAGVPAWDAVARSLMAGVAVHLVAWAVAVAVVKQLMIAELQAAYARRLERFEARAELARADA